MHHGYIYHTVFTHPKTGKAYYYVGQHISSKVDLRYYGSGQVLTRQVKKYGRACLDTSVIYWAKDQEELDFAEIFLISVCKETFGRACTNLRYGGDNGTMSKKTIRKLKAYTGKSSSGYGSRWANNGLANIKLAAGEPLPKGYVYGRALNVDGFRGPAGAAKAVTGSRWVNNGWENCKIPAGKRMPKGFKEGRLKKHKTFTTKGKLWFTDGNDNYLLFPNDPSILKCQLVPGMSKNFAEISPEEKFDRQSKCMKGVLKGRRMYNDGIRVFRLYPWDEKITKLRLLPGAKDAKGVDVRTKL